MRVYVVDDESLVARGFGRLLSSGGYNVEIFTSPVAYLAGAPREGPGCSLIDLHMQEMCGLELQNALFAKGCTLPILFISGNANEMEVRQGLAAGAKGFLRKPIQRQPLLEAVQQVIGGSLVKSFNP